MPVSSVPILTAELGNGTKVAFDFAFKIFAETDLVIYKETASGVYTQQTIVADWGDDPDPLPAANTCFVEFDTDNATGTVTYSEAPENGLASVIVRSSARTQESSLPLEQPMPEKVIQDALDKLTLIVQELQEHADRTPASPVVPVGSKEMIIEAPEDGKVLRWRYDSDAEKWYIENTTYDSGLSADEAAASAAAAAVSAAAASDSADAAADSAAEAAATLAAAVDVYSGLYSARPAGSTRNIWWYSTDRKTLERFIVAANKWFLVG